MEAAESKGLALGRRADEAFLSYNGEGVILRYDEAHKEIVGLVLIGLRARLLKA